MRRPNEAPPGYFAITANELKQRLGRGPFHTWLRLLKCCDDTGLTWCTIGGLTKNVKFYAAGDLRGFYSKPGIRKHLKLLRKVKLITSDPRRTWVETPTGTYARRYQRIAGFQSSWNTAGFWIPPEAAHLIVDLNKPKHGGKRAGAGRKVGSKSAKHKRADIVNQEDPHLSSKTETDPKIEQPVKKGELLPFFAEMGILLNSSSDTEEPPRIGNQVSPEVGVNLIKFESKMQANLIKSVQKPENGPELELLDGDFEDNQAEVGIFLIKPEVGNAPKTVNQEDPPSCVLDAGVAAFSFLSLPAGQLIKGAALKPPRGFSNFEKQKSRQKPPDRKKPPARQKPADETPALASIAISVPAVEVSRDPIKPVGVSTLATQRPAAEAMVCVLPARGREAAEAGLTESTAIKGPVGPSDEETPVSLTNLLEGAFVEPRAVQTARARAEMLAKLEAAGYEYSPARPKVEVKHAGNTGLPAAAPRLALPDSETWKWIDDPKLRFEMKFPEEDRQLIRDSIARAEAKRGANGKGGPEVLRPSQAAPQTAQPSNISALVGLSERLGLAMKQKRPPPTWGQAGIPRLVQVAVDLMPPPLLTQRQFDDRPLGVACVAGWYRAAMLSRYSKCFPQRPNKKTTPFWEDAVQVLFENKMMPAVWVAFSIDDFRAKLPENKAKTTMPTLEYIFGDRMQTQRWRYREVEGFYARTRVQILPSGREILQKSYAIKERAAALDWDLNRIASLVSEYFPNGADVEIKAAQKEADDMTRILKQKISTYTWVWQTDFDALFGRRSLDV